MNLSGCPGVENGALKEMTMMKWFALSLLVVGLGPAEVFAGGNHGHPGAGKHRRGMKANALHRALKKADLTEDQQEQLKALMKKHKAAMKKLRQSKISGAHPMMALLKAEDPSTVSFKKIRQQREQLRLQKERLHFRHLKAVVSLLEPEQRQKVVMELERMKSRWQQRQKRRHMRRWKRKGGNHHGGPADFDGHGPDGDFVD
tara:strand:+ start:433 stop:1038 length:606 start_codon:yes stop_codon:yes gene_type:complete